jgi:hypothetical protein
MRTSVTDLLATLDSDEVPLDRSRTIVIEDVSSDDVDCTGSPPEDHHAVVVTADQVA